MQLPSSPRPDSPLPRFRDLLFATNPYDGFDVTCVEADLQGWGSKAGIFDKLLGDLRPARIIEVGTWKGASAINMARICAEKEIAADILCVDTFIGVHGPWLRAEQAQTVFKLRNGFPTIFETFMRNVIDAELTEVITPLPLPSSEAAQLLAKRRIQADMIYVDGDHSYAGCKADLIAYRPVLTEGGVMLCDDYQWEGVSKAVSEVVAETGADLAEVGNKCVLSWTVDLAPLRDWQAEMTRRREEFERRKRERAEQEAATQETAPTDEAR